MATNTPLQSILLTSSTSTIVFSNIDQNYTDLVLVVSAKVDTALDIWLRCNGDSGSNYGYVTFTGNGTTPTSSRTSNVTEGLLADWDGVPKPTFGHVLTFTLNNYSNTTTYKTSLARSNRGDSGVDFITSTWRNTNAITNLTLRASNGSRTFDAGTTVDLYGIRSGAQKAFGGDTVTTDGNYWYHTFKTSGTFLLQRPTSVDYLVVAGGGGGGDAAGGHGGGGGAGGLRSTVTATGGGGSLESALSMSPGSYTVTVGAGGAGVAHSAPFGNGSNGSNSVFATITSTGGGYGGGYSTNTSLAYVGGSGGSGGGGSDNPGGAVSTSGQGYAGSTGTAYIGGGGGGAGEAGGTDGAGQGGDGIATSISGSSVTYAGGGGGSSASSPNQGGTKVGGDGGGGNGQVRDGAAGSAGTANLGGGGGGSSTTASYSGGSGIVIVRYAV